MTESTFHCVRSFLLFVVMIAVLCGAPSQTVQADDPPAPAGRVLLYTDNTPGAMAWAHAHLWGAHAGNYDVQVVTNHAAFIAALPTHGWKFVVVAEKHAEGNPSYATALGNYVDSGGWAILHRWKKDPHDSPQAGQVVLAPTASHVWSHGATSWVYISTKLDDRLVSGATPGYTTKSFNDVEIDSFSPMNTSAMAALQAGLLTAAAADPPAASCAEQLREDLAAAADVFITRTARCIEAYGAPPGPNGGNGNPEKLGKCLAATAEIVKNRVTEAMENYRLCLDLQAPPPQQQ